MEMLSLEAYRRISILEMLLLWVTVASTLARAACKRAAIGGWARLPRTLEAMGLDTIKDLQRRARWQFRGTYSAA
eukprot:699638-Amphidinium_carterae.1